MITRRQFIKQVGQAGLASALCLTPTRLLAHTAWDEFVPAYALAEQKGVFQSRVEKAFSLYASCYICPRKCGINRLKGEIGFCRSPLTPVIFSAQPHFGEEAPLVGYSGSGTIFFSNCNLRCVFCQNWPIAHEGQGRQTDENRLAEMMLMLQGRGCHNINLVTPTHVMPHILKATRQAHARGLRIPLVYNTSGYELPEIVELLDGLVDIYLPDFKYGHGEQAGIFSAGATDYPEYAKQSVAEMHRQVGLLKTDARGIALRGMIIRHLVMPNRVAGSREILEWIARSLPKSTYLNIMSQYRVEFKAFHFPEIARGITVEEYLEVLEWARELGLYNLDDRVGALERFFLRRRLF
jgi:putative pyruvate formate lyase activating enzyme